MNLDTALVASWLLSSGLRIALILAGAVLSLWLLGLARARFSLFLESSGRGLTAAMRRTRAHTLASVFSSVLGLVIVLIAALMILSELSVNIAPLLAGASLLGLAFSLGSQSFIKDLIGGLFILLEGRFDLGDRIRVGSFAGTVERITLRSTFLRDDDGAVHIIPNGSVDTVSNSSQDWRRVSAEFSLPVSEAGPAVQVLEAAGRQIAADPQWSSKLLDPPVIGEIRSSQFGWIVLRVSARARPADYSSLALELNRRLLNALIEARLASEAGSQSPPSPPLPPLA